MDPENDDRNNDIFDLDDDWQQRTNQLGGMLLQNSELPARLMKNNLGLKNLFKNIKTPQMDGFFGDSEEETTTTTPAPIPGHNMVMAGIAPFRTMLNRFMDMLRNYN